MKPILAAFLAAPNELTHACQVLWWWLLPRLRPNPVLP